MSNYPGPDDNPYASPQVPVAQLAGSVPGRCPKCGSTEYRKVSFTWWGGLLGPKLFSHVKCTRCGQGYNSKTGELNTTNIIIYVVVAFAIAFVVFAVLGAMAAWG
jgi:predicted nucleic-acid-binding Zn-ribbon protein